MRHQRDTWGQARSSRKLIVFICMMCVILHVQYVILRGADTSACAVAAQGPWLEQGAVLPTQRLPGTASSCRPRPFARQSHADMVTD
jgi:hypothetical protein